MALEDTGRAIGKVTKLLSEHLSSRTSNTIAVGRPEDVVKSDDNTDYCFNLFLYEALFDASLKNVSLDEGRPPPLWLVLKYLITSFDSDGNSDSIEAQERLGEGIRALQELSYIPLNGITLSPDIAPALIDSPEVLKITFDEAPSDLLAKLMQGPEEKYHFSLGFQVRPVMIATAEPPSYSLLVGVNYEADPANIVGEEGIQIPVLPSMGPSISEVSPLKFEAGETVAIIGTNLHLSGLSVCLSAAEFAVTAQRPDRLEFRIDESISEDATISAGNHPLSVVQTLPVGRQRSSNLLVASLLPVVSEVSISAQRTIATARVVATITLTGNLLGRSNEDDEVVDDILLALYQDGRVVEVFDSPFRLAEDQTRLILQIPDDKAIPLGNYRIILRVNGQQAKNSPEVRLTG